MKLTREQVEAMLAGATPDWLIYSEPEVGLPPSLFAGKIMEGVNPIEPLTGADLTLAAAAPKLARELLAAWDREAKLRDAATELAQYASYAEIVGAIGHNRPQIRKWCDAVFALNHELGDTP